MTTTATRPKTTGERPAIVGLLWMDGSPHRWVVNVVTWLAAALMVASGILHLLLWDIAYRHVPTLGPLFIAQGVAAIVFAVAASVVRRVWTALIGAGTMIATLAGFLISVNYGLFGFQDSWTGAYATKTFVIEIASAVLFLTAVAFSITSRAARTA
jgi:hypothetical protein